MAIVHGLAATESSSTIGALKVTYTILRAPYDNYSKMGPQTLFELLRTLYNRTLIDPLKGNPIPIIQAQILLKASFKRGRGLSGSSW